MTEPRTEIVLRAWLEAEATRAVPSPELLERVATVPRSSVVARPRLWTTRRAIAVGLAAALLIGALAAAAAIVGLPPSPGLRLGQLSYVLDDGVYVADSDGRNARRVSDGLGVGGPFAVPRWYGPVLTFTADGGGRAFVRVSNEARDMTGQFDAVLESLDAGGNRLASLSAEQLVVHALDGSIVASLPPPTGYAMWDVSDLETLSWLGDDVVVASACLATGDGCFKGSGDGHDLFIIRLDGSVPRRITGPTESAFEASGSRDGYRIAFLYLPPAARWDWTQTELWVMQADDTGRRRLVLPVGVDAFDFSWSPDGRRLAFTPWPLDDASRHGLFVVDVDGSAAARAIAPADFTSNPDARLAWSADGTRVLAAGNTAGSSGLWTFEVDGSKQTLLVPRATDGDWQLIGDEP